MDTNHNMDVDSSDNLRIFNIRSVGVDSDRLSRCCHWTRGDERLVSSVRSATIPTARN